MGDDCASCGYPARAARLEREAAQLRERIRQLQEQIRKLLEYIKKLEEIIKRLKRLLALIRAYCQNVQAEADLSLHPHQPRGTWAFFKAKKEVAEAILEFLSQCGM